MLPYFGDLSGKMHHLSLPVLFLGMEMRKTPSGRKTDSGPAYENRWKIASIMVSVRQEIWNRMEYKAKEEVISCAKMGR